MAAANKGAPEAPTDATKEPELKLIECEVAPRRSVFAGGKVQGPGSLIELPRDEAKRLGALGFLVVEGVEEVPVQSVSVGHTPVVKLS